MLSFDSFVAFRFLTSSAKSTFLNFISWVTIVGIALGVAALIVVMAVMDGFESTIEGLITEASGHFIVTSAEGPVRTPDILRKQIELSVGPQITRMEPFIGSSVMLTTKGKVNAAYLEGLEEKDLKTRAYLKKGRWPSAKPGSPMEIAIGYLVARKLGVEVGDWIGVLSPFGVRDGESLQPRSMRFKVTGIISLGMYDYDKRLAYTTWDAAEEFFYMEGKISGFRAVTKDPLTSYEHARHLRKSIEYPYVIKDWSRLHPNLFRAVKIEKKMMFIILMFIILVAVFNVVSTLVMMSSEKAREIAILSAMGARHKGIGRIFLKVGSFIGVSGTFLGLIIATILIFIIRNYDLVELHADIYYISHLPAEARLSSTVLVCILSIVISVIASVIPALRASSVSPATELKYEG
jgi:lipoprotein-releasing system permease protein